MCLYKHSIVPISFHTNNPASPRTGGAEKIRESYFLFFLFGAAFFATFLLFAIVLAFGVSRLLRVALE